MAKILDQGVGNITAALKSKGIYDSTIQIFSSDNGGPTNHNEGTFSDNFPMRGGKNTMCAQNQRCVYLFVCLCVCVSVCESAYACIVLRGLTTESTFYTHTHTHTSCSSAHCFAFAVGRAGIGLLVRFADLVSSSAGLSSA